MGHGLPSECPVLSVESWEPYRPNTYLEWTADKKQTSSLSLSYSVKPVINLRKRQPQEVIWLIFKIGCGRPRAHTEMRTAEAFPVPYLFQSGRVDGVVFDMQQGLVVL